MGIRYIRTAFWIPVGQLDHAIIEAGRTYPGENKGSLVLSRLRRPHFIRSFEIVSCSLQSAVDIADSPFFIREAIWKGGHDYLSCRKEGHILFLCLLASVALCLFAAVAFCPVVSIGKIRFFRCGVDRLHSRVKKSMNHTTVLGRDIISNLARAAKRNTGEQCATYHTHPHNQADQDTSSKAVNIRRSNKILNSRVT